MVTVTSQQFAHGVHIKGNFKCSDNYFDLLPGQNKTIRIHDVVDLNPVFFTL